jgi:hypothetical protein
MCLHRPCRCPDNGDISPTRLRPARSHPSLPRWLPTGCANLMYHSGEVTPSPRTEISLRTPCAARTATAILMPQRAETERDETPSRSFQFLAPIPSSKGVDVSRIPPQQGQRGPGAATNHSLSPGPSAILQSSGCSVHRWTYQMCSLHQVVEQKPCSHGATASLAAHWSAYLMLPLLLKSVPQPGKMLPRGGVTRERSSC